MKRYLMTLFAMMSFIMSANAMSYNEARQQAYYLTDKMAYELNLNDQQYNDAYEINLDYLLSLNTEADIYGSYLTYRNADLRHILYDWQWDVFYAADYFLHPVRWISGAWFFPIYRWYNVGFHYYHYPSIYWDYRGAHCHAHYMHVSYYHNRRPGWDGGMRGHGRDMIGRERPGHNGRIGEGRGNTGNRGNMDNRGDRGNTGNRGNMNNSGDRGNTGNRGNMDNSGDRGNTGDHGNTGGRGNMGGRGESGNAGSRITNITRSRDLGTPAREARPSTNRDAVSGSRVEFRANSGTFERTTPATRSNNNLRSSSRSVRPSVTTAPTRSTSSRFEGSSNRSTISSSRSSISSNHSSIGSGHSSISSGRSSMSSGRSSMSTSHGGSMNRGGGSRR